MAKNPCKGGVGFFNKRTRKLTQKLRKQAIERKVDKLAHSFICYFTASLVVYLVVFGIPLVIVYFLYRWIVG